MIEVFVVFHGLWWIHISPITQCWLKFQCTKYSTKMSPWNQVTCKNVIITHYIFQLLMLKSTFFRVVMTYKYIICFVLWTIIAHKNIIVASTKIHIEMITADYSMIKYTNIYITTFFFSLCLFLVHVVFSFVLHALQWCMLLNDCMLLNEQRYVTSLAHALQRSTTYLIGIYWNNLFTWNIIAYKIHWNKC